MTLRDLLGEGPDDVRITGLAFDNRQVEPGTLFFCVPGFTRDGHDFAADAVARGAAALVVQRPLGLGVPEVRVDDVRGAMAGAAARFYGDPTARLPVVGITGTNGKTTTAFLVRSLLEASGRPCGLLGTVKSVIGGEEHAVVRTTPEAIDLQRTFAAMLEGGDEACAMEISSHALELRRADGIHVALAVFTNLTQDHLDFHPDMEAYFAAKRLLFASPLTRARIANADDPYGRRLAEEFPGTITFGLEGEADYRASGLRSSFTGTEFTAHTPGGEFATRVSLPGRFNVLNALGAWAAVRELGVGDEEIAAALPGAGAGAGALRAGRRRPAVRRARRLLAHAGLAGERAARGPRAGRAPRDRRVRRGRRPRPRQAAGDGGDRRAARRPGDRHLRQPPLGGPGRDRRRRSWPGSRTARASRRRSTGAPRSSAPSGSPSRATSWSSPARGTSRGRSSRAGARSRSTT